MALPNLFTYLKNSVGSWDARDIGEYVWQADEATDIHRMIVTVRDTGVFREDQYGAGPALENGILVYADNDLITEIPIRHTIDWTNTCHDHNLTRWRASGVGSFWNFNVRWTFSKGGAPLRLQDNDQFKVVIADDCSQLDAQFFHLQGVVIDEDD